jgi:hypothetical protein
MIVGLPDAGKKEQFSQEFKICLIAKRNRLKITF